MKPKTILAVVLLAAGVLCLVYRGFSYTRESHQAKLGPVSLAVKEKERVDLPVWLGVGLVAAGGLLLLVGRDR
jgi:drug/metabolite transporter (DMT)-like permease